MKWISLYVIISLAALTTASGCITGSPGNAKYTDISVQQAKEMMERNEVLILDVRTQEEYNDAHIRNSILIPVQELDKRLEELSKDDKILIYCRTGHRSATASEMLVNNGFTQVYNMKGGIAEWIKAGYEVIK